MHSSLVSVAAHLPRSHHSWPDPARNEPLNLAVPNRESVTISLSAVSESLSAVSEAPADMLDRSQLSALGASDTAI